MLFACTRHPMYLTLCRATKKLILLQKILYPTLGRVGTGTAPPYRGSVYHIALWRYPTWQLVNFLVFGPPAPRQLAGDRHKPAESPIGGPPEIYMEPVAPSLLLGGVIGQPLSKLCLAQSRLARYGSKLEKRSPKQLNAIGRRVRPARSLPGVAGEIDLYRLEIGWGSIGEASLLEIESE